jgi:dihydrodipicolinate synthase/N-acetylneuraminate lyase
MVAIDDRSKGSETAVREALAEGVVIPAHPLALDPNRQLDERRQRALTRYYIASGAGGLAVGVHTTQFRLHDSKCGLLRPVWELAAEEMNRADAQRRCPLIRVAGICGDRQQAVREAELARHLGYHYGLLNLGQLAGQSVERLLEHSRAIADVIGVFGFYLQPKAGGIDLHYKFWRAFCEIGKVGAIKIAAFDRYRTLNVIRAVAESGRDDIALYTGNDDNIVIDLLTPYRFDVGGSTVVRYFVGGLLGQWAVWTSRAVALHKQCRDLRKNSAAVPSSLLSYASQLTDANGAIFDAANGFRGCIPGIHEVLRRQGLLAGVPCLDEMEELSLGQASEIDRVCRAYPQLIDDEFVAANLDSWLSG